MAGMLPGVECARRRRFHQSGSDSTTMAAHGGTRRSSHCLYTSNHENPLLTSTSSPQRRILHEAYENEDLGGEAREAKERLDERLRAQRKSETKRLNSKESFPLSRKKGRSIVHGELPLKKSFCWAKLSWNWKVSDQYQYDSM